MLSGCISLESYKNTPSLPQQEEIVGYVNKDFIETYATTNDSKIVAHIPRGTKILIINTQDNLANISRNPKYQSWVNINDICFTEGCWIIPQNENNLKNKYIKTTTTPKNTKSTPKTATTPKNTKPNQTAPSSGATAKCKDGTLSYSKHRKGTCSHHGGVAIWF